MPEIAMFSTVTLHSGHGADWLCPHCGRSRKHPLTDEWTGTVVFMGRPRADWCRFCLGSLDTDGTFCVSSTAHPGDPIIVVKEEWIEPIERKVGANE